MLDINMVVKISMTAPDGTDYEAEVMECARAIGLDQATSGRHSVLMAVHLFAATKTGMQNPARVIREIEALEGVGEPSEFKPPIQNKHPPLKNLWHKHYGQDGIPSLALNVGHGLKKFKIPLFLKRMAEAEQAGEQRLVKLEDVPALVEDLVLGNLGRLAAAEAMTGEWLIFARHQNKNYYLCLTTHDSSVHPNVRDQIDYICCKEFPWLQAVLDS
jgi:hypothetical protein